MSFFFKLIEIFVFDVVIKYRSTSEFRDVETLERRIDSRDLREQVDKLLDQKMNSVIAFNAWREKQQLHEKIDIYENFIQMKYFDQLKEYSDNIVISIRHDIRQTLQKYLLLVADSEIESTALSSSSLSLSSCLASVLESSSLKKIKSMLKSKRESLTVTTIQNERLSCRAIALRHEVSRMTILRRLKEDRTINEFAKNRQLLFEQEKTIILRFVDEFIALRFSLRKYMIEEKVSLLLRKRRVSISKLEEHWIKRFLRRHSLYRTKFSRHLFQERHWSSDSIVFVQWFDLMRKTMIKYNIAIEDVYNMNEKKYMMRMSEATQWVNFFRRIAIFFAIFFAFLVYSPHFQTISRILIEFEKIMFLK